MAGSTTTEAKFGLNLESNAPEVSDELADSLEHLRARIHASQNAIKDMAGSLRRLRGNTKEVLAAKNELKAKLQAERDAISSANLKLLQAGTSYDKLSERAKKLAGAKKSVIGPADMLKSRLGIISEIANGTYSKLGLVTIAAAGLVAALVALVAATAAAGYGLFKFIVTGANAARSANLLREAANGGAENAYALGTQVDALARKVPTAAAELNALAVSLAKNRLQGQVLVDTFNAVAQASAAMGDDAGGKLRELVERGRLTGRFSLNPLELIGTGLSFDDIAGELGKGMRGGIKEARQALLEGRVPLGAGAAALKDATERKFGNLNLRKMLDINVLAEKFKETLGRLTKDVKLDPLLMAIKQLTMLFDESTVTGSALKQLITIFGNFLVKAFVKGTPLAKKFFQGMIIAALQLGIGVLKLRKWFRETFGETELFKNLDLMTVALEAGKIVVIGLAVSFGIAAVAIGGMVVGLHLAIKAVTWVIDNFPKALQVAAQFFTQDWIGLGANIVDGLIGGLKAGAGRLGEAVKGLANDVKRAFTGEMRMHSPSLESKDWGKNTTKGYVLGLEEGTPEVAGALGGMAERPRLPSNGGGGRGPRPSVTIQIIVQGGGSDAPAIEKQLRESSVVGEIVAALEELGLAQGVA